MSVMRKLLWWKRREPVQRVRICMECGMPVGEHKAWCSILKLQQTGRYRAVEANDND